MPDDVGSFADEAAKLAGVVQGWARGEGGTRASEAIGHMATGEPACCVCPVCTVIVLLRGERPELTGRLTESLAGLVVAGQGLLETLSAVTAEAREAAGTRPPPADPSTHAGDPGPAPHPPRVQHIALDDDPEDDR